eukprot:4592755-Pyramimonas_sp.AAC.1
MSYPLPLPSGRWFVYFCPSNANLSSSTCLGTLRGTCLLQACLGFVASRMMRVLRVGASSLGQQQAKSSLRESVQGIGSGDFKM